MSPSGRGLLDPWRLGALCGLTGVALGAFGAHALQGVLEPKALAAYEVGVRYQMYHAAALCLVSHRASSCVRARRAGHLFSLGILLFSGSLYALALGVKGIGMITPLGGLAFMGGWALMASSSSPAVAHD